MLFAVRAINARMRAHVRAFFLYLTFSIFRGQITAIKQGDNLLHPDKKYMLPGRTCKLVRHVIFCGVSSSELKRLEGVIMTEKAIAVVQSNKLVEARYTLTVGEQRLILAMVSRTKTSDEDFAEYRISLVELSKILDIPLSYVYREIERIINLLMSRVLTIREESGEWLKIHWICKARYAKQSVSLSFVPDLKPYLLRLQKQFTIFDLNIIRKFKSIYTIRIYQLLKQYQGIKEREFDLKDFRKIIGIDDDTYREFYDFRKRIINQALKEMEAKDSKCDLTFQLETIKEGKKITRLKFFIQQRKRAEEGDIAKAV
jgi:plasmid replication initiation protein